MSRRVLGLLLAVSALTACAGGREAASDPSPAPTAAAATPAPAPPSPSAPPARLVWRACEDGFQCARLPVAGLPGGLAVTRQRAGRPADRIGSLVVNPGGPGASAVDYLQAAADSLPAALRQRFDLVAFDPRGVGRSRPVRCLGTAALDAYYALDPSPDTPAEVDALVAGSRRLGQGCARRSGPLLGQVSTATVAEDLERLRAALGDRRLTYLGYSYGTAIGAAYLDRYPTRVRAMVLDGALDPTLSWDRLLEGQSRGFDRALSAFLSDCERTACPFREAVEGDLPAAYDALAARVERRPLPAGGQRDLGPGELSFGAGAGLYDRDLGWVTLGQALADAVEGDGELMLALSDGYLERGPDGYDPLLESNVAVNCADRPFPRDPQAYADLARRVAQRSPRFGPAIVWSGLVCATWPVPSTGEPAPVRGAGAPPVVVVGTTRDPATPYAWAVALADQLDRGVLVTFDGDGHTAFRDGGPGCVVRSVTSYLVSGRAPAATRC